MNPNIQGDFQSVLMYLNSENILIHRSVVQKLLKIIFKMNNITNNILSNVRIGHEVAGPF